MKKIILSSFVILTFGLYAILSQPVAPEVSPITPTIALISPDPIYTPTPTRKPVPTSPPPTNRPLPTATSTPLGKYKNGTYTGSVADASYGNVQVQVVISSGQISSVNFLQYPSDNNTSARKSSYAIPQLTSEAIQSQSANVQIVSSVTFTSQAFMQSLQTALNQAG